MLLDFVYSIITLQVVEFPDSALVTVGVLSGLLAELCDFALAAARDLNLDETTLLFLTRFLFFSYSVRNLSWKRNQQQIGEIIYKSKN